MTGAWRRRLGCGALAGVLAFALYLPSIRHGFIVYDDPLYVTDNRHVLQGFTLEGVRWSFTAIEGGNWHPLTWWSHMLAVAIFGTWAGGHHLLNALLHAGAAAALFWVISGMTGTILPSLAVALLFAVHPLHVESVAWVAERKDVVVGLFWMLTLGAWTAYLRRQRPGRYFAALGLYGLCLMGKPTAVMLPLVLLVLDVWPFGRLERASIHRVVRLTLEKAPFFLAAAAVALVSFRAQRTIGALGRVMDVPPDFRTAFAGIRAANAVVSYATYLGKAFWPTNLAVFYPYPSHALSAWAVALSGLALAGITAVAVLVRRRLPWFAAGWAWYLLVLAPVIGIVQVGSQARADRYAYLPLIGIWLAIIPSIEELRRRRAAFRTAAVAVCAAAIVAFALVAARQLGYWRDTQTLFEHTRGVTGDNPFANRVLGEELRREGRFADAERLFREALRFAPRSTDAYNRLGMALFGEGRLPEAAEAYREAVRINPGYAEARNNLGLTLTAQGELPEAELQLREALRLQPGAAEIWSNLGDNLARQGRTVSAADAYRRALAIRPDFPPVRTKLEQLPAGEN